MQLQASDYEKVGALVRSRIIHWRGYRGQGKTTSFLERVIKLALYLTHHQHRNPGAFPVDRMKLASRVGVPEHSIRTALGCLEAIGLLEPASALERKARGPHYKPRQWRLTGLVLSLFTRKLTRQEEPLTVKNKAPSTSKKTSLTVLVPYIKKEAQDSVAFLRSLFKGTDAEWEAHWNQTPTRARLHTR